MICEGKFIYFLCNTNWSSSFLSADFSFFQIESLAKDFILLTYVQQYNKSGLRRKVDIIG